MADFCGLTRVKTWRWSRLFACAVAVFCAISPISSFADNFVASGYMCETNTINCNAGFGRFLNGGMYNKCTVCPEGTYNASKGLWNNVSCKTCPTGGTCPNVFMGTSDGVGYVSDASGAYDYGRPIVLCGKNYYRTYTNGVFGCEACPNGSIRGAGDTLIDTIRGLGKKIENKPANGNLPGGGFQYDAGNLEFGYDVDNLINNVNHCNQCKDSYYKKGAFTDTSYAPDKLCASCAYVSNKVSCTKDGHVSCRAEYYREIQSDGSVQCKTCQMDTTKDADSDDSTDSSYWKSGAETCNLCKQPQTTKYYYSQKQNDTRCFVCPENSLRDASGMCGDTVTQRDGLNDILCDAGFYRVTNSTTGEVACEACKYHTTKDADETPNDGAQQTCQKCVSGEYYYSRYTYGYECFECPANAVKETVNGVDICNTKAKKKGDTNDIMCDAGYYRVTHEDDDDPNKRGRVECVQCPTGYTKNADRSPDEAATNETLGAASCNKCATTQDDIRLSVNYYHVPGVSTSTSTQERCVPCPPSNDADGVQSCRSVSDNEDKFLLCAADYYREAIIENGKTIGYKCSKCNDTTKSADKYTDGWGVGVRQCSGGCAGGMFSPTGEISTETCFKCPDYETAGTDSQVYAQCDQSGPNGTGVLRCKANYYYYFDQTPAAVASKTQYKCARCPTVDDSPNGQVIAGKDEDTTNVIGVTSGSAQCNKCSDGFFAPDAANQNPETCALCPSNAKVCENGNIQCSANYYYYDNKQTGLNRHQCVKCPVFTGKLADTGNMIGGSGDESQCDICTDGWYGNVGACGECPAFARLDALGVCIHGTTDGPDDNSGSGFQTTLQSCYIPNASSPVVSDKTLFDNLSYTVRPYFSDTEGIFQFINTSSEANTVGICEVPSSAKISPSGRCKLEAGKICVYINGDVDVNNLNANACIKAIMWRTKDGDDAPFGISDKTAKMVFSHWGKNNPWYCATPNPANDTTEALVNAKTVAKQEAQAFVACLTGNNDDCKYSNLSCMPVNSANVKVCETDGNGGCTDVTN